MEKDSTSSVVEGELRQGRVARDIFMVFLALVSIAVLIYDEVATVPPEDRLGLVVIDAVIVLIFAIEFAAGLWQAESKKSYWKSHWWELLGLVPMAAGDVSFLRVFRLARLVRLVRILRIISVVARLRRANRIAKGFLGQSHLGAIATLGATLIVACAYLEFLFEKDANPQQFATFWDALWWATVTTTTVGYGDKFPLTVGGKIVATVLMFTGIGLIGLLAGSLANALIKGPPAKGNGAARPLEERLAALASLHSTGKLNDQEFQEAKARLLREP